MAGLAEETSSNEIIIIKKFKGAAHEQTCDNVQQNWMLSGDSWVEKSVVWMLH